jgi:hypothetical protein
MSLSHCGPGDGHWAVDNIRALNLGMVLRIIHGRPVTFHSNPLDLLSS